MGTQFPMPVSIRDTLNAQLMNDQLSMLDDNARLIVRRIVAEAYAVGFADGRIDEQQSAWVNSVAAKDSANAEVLGG